VVAWLRGTNIKLERIFDGLIEQSKELNGCWQDGCIMQTMPTGK
jgi:hypothetical protein